ncbi:PIR protein [Plasmodium vivax]|uniref:VIR protein n=1 Tax=Plasmodium vivax TaxID=5855 RepID=A0A565A7E8_PLAVI|nr:PIR protein [Plasmodium vivax]
MAKPAAASVISAEKLEKAAEVLKLKTYYDDFFSKNEQPKSADLCKIFDTQDKKKENEKKICLKLVRHLEKIGEITEKPKRDEHCNYLTYWFYDEIGKIYNDHLSKINEVQFFKDLIGVGNDVNKKKIVKNTCFIKSEIGVSLDEWKKRKLSYIYKKNYNDIKSKIGSQNKEQCDKYSKYLDNINKLYINYKTKKCSWFTLSPDYADCSYNYDPKKIITELAKCKTQGSNGRQSSFIGWLLGSPSSGATQNKGSPGAQEQARTAVAKSPERVASTGGKFAGTERADANKGLSSVAPKQSREVLGRTQNAVVVAPRGNSQAGVHMPHGSKDIQQVSYTTLPTAPGIEQTKLVGANNFFSNFFEKTSGILKSEYFRHSIVGASIIGVLVFLFFFFKSTPIGSHTNKGEKKKRKPQNSYYDEYEEELPRYESQQSFAEFQMSDAYISYQPRRDHFQEKIAEELKLKTFYDDFFLKNEQPKSVESCKIFETQDKKKENEKKICLNLVRHLEKIGEMTEISKRYDHCNYLTYWFYDEIGKIYNDHLSKINEVQFFKDLIGVGNDVNKKKIVKNTCFIKSEIGVSLDEWKKRKLSYIYKKNYNDIKSKIGSQNKEQCDKYSKYLDNINKLYINYKTKKCSWFTLSPDYADCSYNYDPKKIITELAKCKTQGSNGSQSSFLGWFWGSSSPKTAPSKGSPGAQEPAKTAVVKSSGGIVSIGGKVAGAERAVANKGLSSVAPKQSREVLGGSQNAVVVAPLGNSQGGVHMPPGSKDIQNGSYTTLPTAFVVDPDTSNFLEKTFGILKSEYFRHSIVGASIIGVLVFLFFFFKSTPRMTSANVLHSERQ